MVALILSSILRDDLLNSLVVLPPSQVAVSFVMFLISRLSLLELFVKTAVLGSSPSF
eukprot:CAMPEP_0194342098 /NCGR_PEP_ID=MMETSP0171-20130528/91805_1 /TAXON_ID=218684 /ORGANISM="Corethron pennatum, Strain L29A3" /LENGTH=56 /DNA_ID=CAMNT_0039107691 /DNA_START=36 /DNA_END=203 /DNA_ORIENTATION=+